MDRKVGGGGERAPRSIPTRRKTRRERLVKADFVGERGREREKKKSIFV